MIKIRYRDPNELSPGLHAEAERRGRCTTVYLLSGLTKQERRAALRRLRLSARMGYCPRLPAPQLALALFKDRIRTGAWQTGAVVRLHPAGSTVPVMVLSGGVIAFLLLSTVSIHLRPRIADQTPAGSPPIAEASAIPFPGSSRDPAGAGLGNPGQSGLGSVPVSAVSPLAGGLPLLSSPGLIGTGTGVTFGPWTSASSTGTGTGTGAGTGSSGSTSQAGTGQSGSPNSSSTNSNAGGSNGGGSNGGGSNGGTSQSSGSTSSDSGGSGSGSGSGSGTSSSSSGGGDTSTSGSTSAGSTTPTPTPTTTPAPSSTGSGGGVCLGIGPLGVCLNV